MPATRSQSRVDSNPPSIDTSVVSASSNRDQKEKRVPKRVRDPTPSHCESHSDSHSHVGCNNTITIKHSGMVKIHAIQQDEKRRKMASNQYMQKAAEVLTSSSSMQVVIEEEKIPVAGSIHQHEEESSSSTNMHAAPSSSTVNTAVPIHVNYGVTTPTVLSPLPIHLENDSDGDDDDDVTLIQRSSSPPPPPNTPSTPINQQMSPPSLSTPVAPIMKECEKPVNQVHHNGVEMSDDIESNDSQPNAELQVAAMLIMLASKSVNKSLTPYYHKLQECLASFRHIPLAQAASWSDKILRDLEIDSPVFRHLLAQVETMHVMIPDEEDAAGGSLISCKRFYLQLTACMKEEFINFSAALALSPSFTVAFDSIPEIAHKFARQFQRLQVEMERAAAIETAASVNNQHTLVLATAAADATPVASAMRY